MLPFFFRFRSSRCVFPHLVFSIVAVILCSTLATVGALPTHAASRAIILDFESTQAASVALPLSPALQASGFEVQLADVKWPLNADSITALQREIERTATACAPEDILLVHVRGFCREQNGRKYLGAPLTSSTPPALAGMALSDLINTVAMARGATLLFIDAGVADHSISLTQADVQRVWDNKPGAAASTTNAAQHDAVMWLCRPRQTNDTQATSQRDLAFFVAQGIAGRAADAQGVVRSRSLMDFVAEGVFGATWIEQGEEQIPIVAFASPAAGDAILARDRLPGNSGQTVLSTTSNSSSANNTAPATLLTAAQSTLSSASVQLDEAMQRACEAWLLDRPREAWHWSRLALTIEEKAPLASTPPIDTQTNRRRMEMARIHLLAGLMAQRLEGSNASSAVAPGQSSKYFRRAMELAPSWWRTSFEVARALHTAGDFEGAAGMFKSALQLGAQRPEIWIELGRLEHFGRKNLPAAQAAYESALEIAPRNASAMNGLANVLFDTNDFAGAARWFERAVGLQPQRAAWRLNLAWALLHIGRRAESQIEAQRALAVATANRESLSAAHPLWAKVGIKAPAPMPVAAWHPAAVLDVRRGEAARVSEEGEKQFAARQFRLAQLSGHSVLALLDVAPSWITDLAATTTDTTTGTMSKHPGAAALDAASAPLVARATALLGRLAATWHNDVATSKTLLAHSLQAYRDANALTDLATLMSAATDETPALSSDASAVAVRVQELLDEAIKLAPNDARPWSGLGEIAYRRFDYETAQKYFEEALKRDERDVRAVYGMGEIATNAGRYDEAEKYFARATEAAPQNALFWNRRGIFASSIRKDSAAAEAHFRRALQADPKFSVAAANLGVLLMNTRSDFAAAAPLLQRAVQHAPREGLYHFHLGFCLMQLDRKPEAVESVKRALALGFNVPRPVLARLGLTP